MKNKRYFYLAIIGFLAVTIVLLIIGCTQQSSLQNKPTTLIFKLKNDYSGSYIGTINYYNNTNTYRSFGTFELFDYCYQTTKSTTKEDETTGQVYPGETITQEICFSMNGDDPKSGVIRLSNNYYAVTVPNSESMIKKFAIFDKSIITKAISEIDRLPGVPEEFPKGIKPGMGDSVEMSRDEFYSYVIDDSPLIEAYFCDEPKGNLNAVARDLSNGEIPKTCKQII